MNCNENCKNEYKRWLNCAISDQDLIPELKAMSDEQIQDAFYKNLEFGTGGLRGVIGAGTNRMNIYTVAKASQGLANYLNKNFDKPSVVIGYDSRIKSDLFARTAASVFAANNVQVNIWSALNPVPTVSYGVRNLSASAGIMITASHNPSKYNGYKVYGPDGCQITTDAADAILTEINSIDIFSDIKYTDYNTALKEGQIIYIDDSVMDSYIESVKSQSVLFGDDINKDVSIVYSPLNGTGYIPVTRALNELGYTNISLAEEQRLPDGNFPTCPYPNPEIRDAMELGLKYAAEKNADLLLATDPDCDRVGIAVKNNNGEYQLLSGNEVGLLLLDYICSQRIKHDKMPDNPVMIKTIVTMDLAEKIAAGYGVKIVNVLTGFKFIGEQIGLLEKQGRAESYIFGFEESYGYLSGTYVRDKDGVNGACLICEMFAYYKTRDISLIDKLNDLYQKYGYCLNTLHSYEFDGADGFAKMQSIMHKARTFLKEGTQIAGKTIMTALDYSIGLDNLPKSDVLKYILDNNSSLVIRPSGTEPKLKLYLSVSAQDKINAQTDEISILKETETLMQLA